MTSNTKDLKPFVSEITDEFPPAVEIFDQAIVELNGDNLKKSDSLFTYAKELDALRFRAPEIINDVIRELADGFDYNIAEIDSAFRNKSIDGIVGYELTVDHLHPNIEGYNLMAKEFYKMMDKLGYYYLYGMNWLDAKMRREEGIETIEWIAMAAVILALLSAMLLVVKKGGRSIGSLMIQKMKDWLNRW